VVRARSKNETRWGRCRVIVFTSMLYVKSFEPNENGIETGEEKKSKQKGRFMEEESGRKRKKKKSG
jgi:hypothetical protein